MVPEMMSLERLLTTFLTKHAHLGMVVDEFGGTMGIVTLDNVLAEIVGDIHDEFDAEQTEFKRSERRRVRGGRCAGPLRTQRRDRPGSLTNTEVSTIGGYITHLFGHLPRQGEQVQVGDYLATVTKADGRRIGHLHFKRIPPVTGGSGVKNRRGRQHERGCGRRLTHRNRFGPSRFAAGRIGGRGKRHRWAAKLLIPGRDARHR